MASRRTFLPWAAEFGASGFPQLVNAGPGPALAFDADTLEACYFTDIAPQDLTGALTLVVYYIMASATAGAVRFLAQVEAVTPGDALDLDAATSFDASNHNGGTVPGTAGYLGSISITLTNADGIAAGDYYKIVLARDAAGTTGTDSATGDAYVLAVELRDAA